MNNIAEISIKKIIAFFSLFLYFFVTHRYTYYSKCSYFQVCCPTNLTLLVISLFALFTYTGHTAVRSSGQRMQVNNVEEAATLDTPTTGAVPPMIINIPPPKDPIMGIYVDI